MPFRVTNTFPPDPDVEIRFRGLLLLIPVLRGVGPDTNCVVSILRAEGHSRKIRVFDKADLTTPIATPTGRAITTPLRISSTDTGVTKFVSTTPFPGSEDDLRNDFRWSVDLNALHPTSTSSSDPAQVDLGITLTDGLLHTAIRTKPEHMAIMLRHPNGRRKHFNRIAAEVGANYYLGVGQNVTLQWTDQTARTWSLPKGGPSGNGFLIRIDNLPDDDTEHDDFAQYYDAIVTADAHYDLDFYKRVAVEAGESLDAPCMAGVFDGDGRTF